MPPTSIILAQTTPKPQTLEQIRAGEWNQLYLFGGAIVLVLVLWLALRGRASKR